MSGIRFVTAGFDRATKALQDNARRNTQTYGRVLAQSYETEAKRDAPWTDRRGNARRHLYGTSSAAGSTVRVEMGGAAPNYKNTPMAAKDYMEYLEFANGGKFATVYPTAEAIADSVTEDFGDAALRGKMRPRIKRNRKELNHRRKKFVPDYLSAGNIWKTRSPDAYAYQNWLRERNVFNR